MVDEYTKSWSLVLRSHLADRNLLHKYVHLVWLIIHVISTGGWWKTVYRNVKRSNVFKSNLIDYCFLPRRHGGTFVLTHNQIPQSPNAEMICQPSIYTRTLGNMLRILLKSYLLEQISCPPWASQVLRIHLLRCYQLPWLVSLPLHYSQHKFSHM